MKTYKPNWAVVIPFHTGSYITVGPFPNKEAAFAYVRHQQDSTTKKMHAVPLLSLYELMRIRQ